ncbi:hypothetical protein B0A48_00936 [Cryoendolithus antarcticus]|uniref:Uncharacterized protein n=1 Tax=Cryoendolithus antarcticus TaxID=1507870 RepID=A0A1V8TRS2_9PEZI|nr:hypothetical protein B0A48_00936 [Cryoendolithus antarcticus]
MNINDQVLLLIMMFEIGSKTDPKSGDVYDIDNPNDAGINIALNRMPGYKETWDVVKKTPVREDFPGSEEVFRGLSPTERMVVVFKDWNLAAKYWEPHWPGVIQWTPTSANDARNYGHVQDTYYDTLSIMNLNSVYNMRYVGRAGVDVIPFATLGVHPKIGPGNSNPPNQHLVWIGGHPNPRVARMSDTDVARVRAMYPLEGAGVVVPRSTSSNRSATYVYKPAFKPRLVIMGTTTITVRPAPPIPSGNDYESYLGPAFNDPTKTMGLGVLGGPFAIKSIVQPTNHAAEFTVVD